MSFRLEPTPRSPGIEEGLAARVHDALWMLARQWQLGEYNGKDAGTPVVVRATGESSPIDAWRGLNQPDWNPFDSSAAPLDTLVEPEDEAQPTLRERVEAGAHFLRLLTAAGLAKLASAFVSAQPFDAALLAGPDFAGDPLFAAIARRSPDGLPLHDTAVALGAGQPQPVVVDPADLPTLVAVANSWLGWYAGEIHTQTGTGTAVTWQEHRMEYGFEVSSPAAFGTVLVAGRYPGDGLDWFDFDIDTASAANQSAPDATLAIDVQAVPHPVRFAGMPLPRFWAMEDASCDFGSIDAAPNDIGRLLLVEFATVYGNDWYVLPLKIPAGTLTILDTVTVTDVFGRTSTLGWAGSDPAWNMFSLAAPGSGEPAREGLLLPPTSGHVMESRPSETVLFLRDEMADLAWGVEALVQNALEAHVNRRSAWVAPGKLPPGTPDLPAYRVETVVPDYWIPLAPEQLADQKSIHLRMVPLEVDDGGVPATVEPKGLLLQSNDSGGRLWLYEEEIPQEGTQVDRLYRYARWQDGRTSLWTARRRSVGRGEGSSGLRFDVLDPG